MRKFADNMNINMLVFMNRRKSLYAALAISIAMLAICGCNRNGLDDETPSIIEDIEYNTDVYFKSSIYIAPGISPYFDEPLRRRVTKMAPSVQEANVVICPTSFISANAELLDEYINHNGIIIEIEPQIAGHNAWFGKHRYGKIDEFMSISAYGVYKNNIYLLDDIFAGPADSGDIPDDSANETASESSGLSGFVNLDCKPIEIGKTAEYCDIKLNSLVEWANKYSTVAQSVSPYDNDDAVPRQIQELSSLISNSECTMHITYSVEVNIKDYTICKVALSDPDKITRSSSVDVELYVTPFFAYQDPSVNPAGRGGDYYFVQQTVTSHNQPMYGSYRKKHGLIVTQANAFWLKDMHTEATLCSAKDMNLFLFDVKVPTPLSPDVLSFEQTPSPISTQGSGSYTSGFSAALNVNGQFGALGGKPTGTITVGGTFTWSTSQSRTMSDYAIEMSTESNTRSVIYHYKTLNTMEDDDPDKAVPAIGRTDRSDEASWCWHVNNTADKDTTTCFYINLMVDPVYGFMYRHATWSAEGHTKTCSAKNTNSRMIRLPIPDRTLSGMIELTSTNSNILSDVQFINNETGEVAASFNSVYQAFDRVVRQVPVGNYSVLYSIYNGDDSTLIGKFRIPSVDVQTAATTRVSTLDGEWYE